MSVIISGHEASSRSLLATKLFIPKPHPDLVARPRLIARVIEGVTRKLTLVSAPPGAGKTTLIIEWRKSAYGQRMPLAWLTLDERENDPVRFLSYLLAAIETIRPEAGQGIWSLLQSSTPADLEYLLTQLINNLNTDPQEIALAIDDYHAITNPDIHAAVDFLLANMPPHLHLILTTRGDPPLALARLRASGELSEIRAEDLRFTRDEIAALLNDISQLNLDAGTVAALEERTEGWAAGIHLANLSIQGREDPAEFLATFSGENRYVVDYLVEEVLSRQPEGIQDFLLATSVLERFSADLCAAVTDRQDARSIIEQLETTNLFVVALDSERQWYRYHQLFGDLLRQRLNQQQQERYIQIARDASIWFEEQGIEAEAIHYAIHAKDGERIARLVESVSERALHRGQIDTLERWLEAVPDDLRRQRPRLSACAMWIRLSRGQIDEMLPFLEEIEASSLDPAYSDDDRRLLRAIAAAGHSRVALHERDFERTVAQAKIALADLPKEMPIARSSTLFSRGFAEAWTGCVNDSALTFEEAVEVSAQIESAPFYLIHRTALGQNRLHQGRLREAQEVHEESLRFAAERGILNWPFIGYIRISLGRLLYEKGDLDGALEQTLLGIELAKDWSTIVYQIEGYYILTLISLSHRNTEGAREALNRARSLVPVTGSNPDLERIHAYQALIDLFEGNTAAARAWAEPQLADLSVNLDRLWNWWPVYRAALRIAGDTGDIDNVLRACDHMLDVADDACWVWGAMQIRVSKARSLWQCGRCEDAKQILQETLDQAEPEGFLRLFSHGGVEVREILNELRPLQESCDFIDRVLGQFGAPASSNGSPVTPNDQLIEPLSDRELEVLDLIVQGLTNAEIAEALFVATGTVKTHAHNIYGKLGVRTRTQAVARARQLGLVAA